MVTANFVSLEVENSQIFVFITLKYVQLKLGIIHPT